MDLAALIEIVAGLLAWATSPSHAAELPISNPNRWKNGRKNQNQKSKDSNKRGIDRSNFFQLMIEMELMKKRNQILMVVQLQFSATQALLHFTCCGRSRVLEIESRTPKRLGFLEIPNLGLRFRYEEEEARDCCCQGTWPYERAHHLFLSPLPSARSLLPSSRSPSSATSTCVFLGIFRRHLLTCASAELDTSIFFICFFILHGVWTR